MPLATVYSVEVSSGHIMGITITMLQDPDEVQNHAKLENREES